ncbi:MAG: hypothetical protein HY884_05430 [Deltaproteobacteria bacterium]|nr:hypothetical protein [Deltaproteobacteria bacterium]
MTIKSFFSLERELIDKPFLFDDFLGNTLNGEGLWTLSSVGAAPALLTGVTGGQLSMSSGPDNISALNPVGFGISGGTTLTFESRFKRNASYAPSRAWFGFADSTTWNGPSNAIILDMQADGGNWKAVTTSGGTSTTTDTGVAGTNSWQKLKVVATSTSVAFYIDDVLKATHTTNIPTAKLGVCVSLYRTPQNTTMQTIDYIMASSSVRNN